MSTVTTNTAPSFMMETEVQPGHVVSIYEENGLFQLEEAIRKESGEWKVVHAATFASRVLAVTHMRDLHIHMRR